MIEGKRLSNVEVSYLRPEFRKSFLVSDSVLRCMLLYAWFSE